MNAVSWLLVAVGLVLMPRRASGSTAARDHAGLPADGHTAGRLSPRALALGAAGVSAAGCAAALGIAGLAVALVVAPLCAVVVGWLANRPARAAPDPAVPLALDLVSAALLAGQPLASALLLAAPATRPDVCEELTRIAGLLRLGADPEVAWRPIRADSSLGPVAATSRRSAHSGIRLARAYTDLAVELRAAARASAQARAHRAGVFAMLPLGLCFLPAFVCLGVAPTVAGIAATVLGSAG